VVEGKFDMGTFEGLLKGGKRGPAVVAGKSAESLIYQMAGHMKKPIMPPKAEKNPMTPQELALVKLWIDQGAKPPTMARERVKIALTLPPVQVKPVRAIVVSADKKVAAGRGNKIHLYDGTTGNHIKSFVDPGILTADQKPAGAAHISLVESLAFSPDGKLLASGSFREVTIWDVTTGQVKLKLPDVFADRIVTLAFSPNGKLLATGGGAPTEDGEIKVFEADTGKLAFEVKSGHSDTVYGVSFSPDGAKLATCGADKFVKVWEVPGGKLVKTFEGHTHHVLDVGWKSDGKLLASAGADNEIKVWDFEKGEQVRPIKAHTKQVTRLVFVANKPEFVTCSGDQSVRMWNADNGGNVRNFGNSPDYLYALGVSPDGSVVAYGGEEGVVRLYNGTNGQLVKALVPPGEEPMPPPKK
jgi:WD40 repeat protein